MKLKKYESPQAVEELVFKVKPELIDKWVELDYEIWTKGLAQWPGFAGKEIWINRDKPGIVTAVVYWSDYSLWKSVDETWLAETDERFTRAFGAENVSLVRELHTERQMLRICEVVMEESA